MKHFKMAHGTWRILPNLYKDVTRLYWGISHYRNSFQRPMLSDGLFDEGIFNIRDINEVKVIPVRCFRSKRTLLAILRTFLTIYKSLSRLMDNNIGEYCKVETEQLYADVNNYLPSDTLELSEIMSDLDSLIEFSAEEKMHILNIPEIDIFCGYPDKPVLQLCFWVHKHNELAGNPHILAVNLIRNRLEMLENRLIKEINYYKKGLDGWDMACRRLKEKVVLLRQAQK